MEALEALSDELPAQVIVRLNGGGWVSLRSEPPSPAEQVPSGAT